MLFDMVQWKKDMKIIAKASKCRVCGVVASPAENSCPCWKSSLGGTNHTSKLMSDGVLIETPEGISFFTISEVRNLLRDRVELYSENGELISYDMLPDDI
jgi:hypothetical protein